jgi:hypothetical protein
MYIFIGAAIGKVNFDEPFVAEFLEYETFPYRRRGKPSAAAKAASKRSDAARIASQRSNIIWKAVQKRIEAQEQQEEEEDQERESTLGGRQTFSLRDFIYKLIKRAHGSEGYRAEYSSMTKSQRQGNC